jgi:hypothetical protein
MAWFLIFLISVGLFLAFELLRPKQEFEDAKPAGLGEFNFPTATEGRVVPVLWGTVRTEAPNVVWYGDFTQSAITEYVKTGLFSGDRFTTGYRYYMGVQAALCRGPGVILKRMWIGDDQVFSGSVTHGNTFSVDEPTLFGGDDLGAGGFVGTFEFFAGTTTQSASTYLSTFQQISGVTPAYRGTCYIAPETDPIYLGNSTSIRPWKFELQRIPNSLSLGAVSTTEANPAEVIYEILTDSEFLGVDTADVDLTTFTAAGNTLATEGNGFSMIVDSAMRARDLIGILLEQIDGVLYFDGVAGKWKLTLVRDDYDIDLVTELDATNVIEIKDFARGSWDETVNYVRVRFYDGDDDYKETFAIAQDQASVRVIRGRTVLADKTFPGVKKAALANAIAWRELRALAYPLARAQVTTDRTLYAAQPGDLIAFSGTVGGYTFSKLPMRVNAVDLGDLLDNKVTLDLVQDVFYHQTGAFGDPPDSNWTPPDDDLDAFPSDEQLAFEAPRAFVYRDPADLGIGARIWASGQKQGPEVSFKIYERHAAGTPSGSFVEDGEAFGFMVLGTLTSNLDAGTAIPTTTVNITPWTGVSQSTLEAAFEDDPNITDQGVNFQNLILIDNEFMLVRSAANGAGSTVDLTGVYRAVLDTVQANHSSGTTVYLLFAGGGLSNSVLPSTNNVHIKLLPRSRYDTVDIGDATQISLTLADRFRRPYPPSSLSLESSLFATTTSLEGAGSGAEDYGIDLEINRRDFRTAEGGDEIEALTTDGGDLFGDFPSYHSTDQQVDVRNDPDGANTLLFTDTYTAATHTPLRIEILKATDGVLPTRMRFVLRTRHTFESTLFGSRQELTWDFDVTTGLTGQFNFGALDTDDVSNLYTATVAGTYSFTLSSAFTAGDVEYRLNGGGWTTLISATGTNGNIAGVSISDTIEIRHRSSDTDALKQCDMAAAGAGQDGYAIFYT